MSTSDHFLQVSVTVDAVAFAFIEGELSLLCPKRGASPYKGRRALPGGFLLPEERLSDALMRVIKNKTALTGFYHEQLETFDELGRDPRDRVISVAYLIILNGSGSSQHQDWIPVSNVGQLPFDHTQMLARALERLRAKVTYTDIGLYFLEQSFTLSQAQLVFEKVLNQSLEKRNFRKQLVERGLVEDTGATTKGGAHRPAKLYRMKHRSLFYWS